MCLLRTKKVHTVWLILISNTRFNLKAIYIICVHLHLITNTISHQISHIAQLFALQTPQIHKAQTLTLQSISAQSQLRSCPAQFVKF